MTSKPRGQLPVARINTIMRSSSNAQCINRASTLLMVKATELFIKSLAQEAHKLSDDEHKLDYNHLAQVVNANEKYDFLKDIMPKKITVLEYKKILARKQNGATTSEGSDSDDSDLTDSE